MVKVLLDSGSGMTSISEGVLARLQIDHPGFSLERPFQGAARVRTAFGEQRIVDRQTVPLFLTLMTPWGRVRFQLPFIILPGPGDLIVVGRVTLQEVLCVDVVESLERAVLRLKEALVRLVKSFLEGSHRLG